MSELFNALRFQVVMFPKCVGAKTEVRRKMHTSRMTQPCAHTFIPVELNDAQLHLLSEGLAPRPDA